MLSRIAAIGTILPVLLLPTPALAALGGTTLEDLVARSDAILVGHIDKVHSVAGVRVAEVSGQGNTQGLDPMQGLLPRGATWMCDTSDADPGTDALLFLKTELLQPTTELSFHPPNGFKEELSNLTGGATFFHIAHSGRGYMPLSGPPEERTVSLWVSYVRPPPT